MKRSSLPFFLAALIAVLITFSLQSDPSIDASAFEPRFREAARAAGLSVVNESNASKVELDLPWTVEWHPRRWKTRIANRPESGIDDGVDHYGLAGGKASRVDCFVRYLDGRVQVIAVRPINGDLFAAGEMRVALNRQFPKIPVKLQSQ